MKNVLALFASAWFLCAGAWAQAPSASPAFVDSREECTALGGAWLASRGTFLAACQVPFAREECLRLGGGWTPMTAAPAGGLCIAQITQAATARQCADSGGTWGPPGSAMPYCQPGTARAAAPMKAASDANKVCSNQKECIYGCVYNGPALATGTEAPGRCRATNRIEGCYAMVDQGRIAGTICMK